MISKKRKPMHKLNPYFKKLNINSKTPTLELLTKLQQKHIETFSFNNIAVLLGKEISLNLEDIIEKIVTKNLGGYCFEHNSLMFEALKSLGFNVRIVIGKVLNNQTEDKARTHRITLVELDNERYIVDVGFGAFCPNVVLKLHEKEMQGEYRMVSLGNDVYQLEMLTEKGFYVLYRFDLAEYTEADCVMGNFYSSKHPNAVFVNNLVVALRGSECTLSLKNGVYHKIGREGREIVTIGDARALQKILCEDFLICLELDVCEVLI